MCLLIRRTKLIGNNQRRKINVHSLNQSWKTSRKPWSWMPKAGKWDEIAESWKPRRRIRALEARSQKFYPSVSKANAEGESFVVHRARKKAGRWIQKLANFETKQWKAGSRKPRIYTWERWKPITRNFIDWFGSQKLKRKFYRRSTALKFCFVPEDFSTWKLKFKEESENSFRDFTNKTTK